MVISLYIHIPFCTKKCPYCHFYVVQESEALKNGLLDALCREWQALLPKVCGREVQSIYFGGGTPTLFGRVRIERFLGQILKECRPVSDCEITIEANPESTTREDLAFYKAVGINRLSFGVQSFDDSLLDILGRTHSTSRAKEAVWAAKEAGFDNCSIDLMYELPRQTLSGWQKTLTQAIELPITHLSLYNLTIEPHTAFHRKEAALKPLLPSNEESTLMYTTAIEMMASAGFHHYEISAFCKNGLISRHNTGYWTGRFFFGLGPSAFSYYGDRRYQNVANLTRYCKLLEHGASTVDFEEVLDAEKRKKELLALRFRLLDGVLKSEVPEGSLATVNLLMASGFIEEAETRFRLTRQGILFYDTVASELI